MKPDGSKLRSENTEAAQCTAARRELMACGKLIEALTASPKQYEDVNIEAMRRFDRAAVLYLYRLDAVYDDAAQYRADLLSEALEYEARPRYSSVEEALARRPPAP